MAVLVLQLFLLFLLFLTVCFQCNYKLDDLPVKRKSVPVAQFSDTVVVVAKKQRNSRAKSAITPQPVALGDAPIVKRKNVKKSKVVDLQSSDSDDSDAPPPKKPPARVHAVTAPQPDAPQLRKKPPQFRKKQTCWPSWKVKFWLWSRKMRS
jgi:hypothetical protein